MCSSIKDASPEEAIATTQNVPAGANPTTTTVAEAPCCEPEIVDAYFAHLESITTMKTSKTAMYTFEEPSSSFNIVENFIEDVQRNMVIDGEYEGIEYGLNTEPLRLSMLRTTKNKHNEDIEVFDDTIPSGTILPNLKINRFLREYIPVTEEYIGARVHLVAKTKNIPLGSPIRFSIYEKNPVLVGAGEQVPFLNVDEELTYEIEGKVKTLKRYPEEYIQENSSTLIEGEVAVEILLRPDNSNYEAWIENFSSTTLYLEVVGKDYPATQKKFIEEEGNEDTSLKLYSPLPVHLHREVDRLAYILERVEHVLGEEFSLPSNYKDRLKRIKGKNVRYVEEYMREVDLHGGEKGRAAVFGTGAINSKIIRLTSLLWLHPNFLTEKNYEFVERVDYDIAHELQHIVRYTTGHPNTFESNLVLWGFTKAKIERKNNKELLPLRQ